MDNVDKGDMDMAQRVRVRFEDRLSLDQAEYVIAKLWYSIEGILACEINSAAGAFEIETAQLSEAEVIRATTLLMDEASVMRMARRTRLRESEANPPDEFAIVNANDPQFREEEARLLVILDDRVRNLAQSFGARLRQYPSMIAYEVMERSNYLWEFPQDLYMVYECPHDIEALAMAKTLRSFTNIVRPTAAMMAPAICYHCYAEYQDQRLSRPLMLTASGPCFRHESPVRLNFWRLSEFHMREIVFMGSSTYVDQTRQALMEAVWTWFTNLGLVGKVESASDPFYFQADYAKQYHQLRDGAKYELSVTVPEGRQVAVASFNDLGTELCQPFEILEADGEIAHSGCVGVGLERLARALITYHGPVLSQWPTIVRDALMPSGSMMMHG